MIPRVRHNRDRHEFDKKLRHRKPRRLNPAQLPDESKGQGPANPLQ